MTESQMEPPTQFVGETVTIKIDRPLGSRHPDLPGVPAPDGEDLDAYLLGVFEPVDEFTGVCIAVVHRFDDPDDKIVIAPEGVDYTDDQIMALTEFIERWYKSEVIR